MARTTRIIDMVDGLLKMAVACHRSPNAILEIYVRTLICPEYLFNKSKVDNIAKKHGQQIIMTAKKFDEGIYSFGTLIPLVTNVFIFVEYLEKMKKG